MLLCSWLQSRHSQGPGGSDVYPKQLNPGVEMGAEVSPHWGSASLQGPSPSEPGRPGPWLLGAGQGRTFLSPWLSLHQPAPLLVVTLVNPWTFKASPESASSTRYHTCPLLLPAASPGAQSAGALIILMGPLSALYIHPKHLGDKIPMYNRRSSLSRSNLFIFLVVYEILGFF